VIVHPETDNPDRFRAGSRVYTEHGEQLSVERSQDRSEPLLVRFEGVVDRNCAESLVGSVLYVPSDERRPLETDEYWPDELVGFTIRSASGDDLGVVEDVIEGAAQYRLLIHGERGRFEIPFVRDLVPEVNLAEQVMVIVDLPGLVPD
jgi:16S rRNA processing protein RimM